MFSEIDEQIQSVTQTSTMVSAGLAALVTLIASSINISSPAMLYLMMGQFKNYMLILLIDVYIPDSVNQYILGLEIFSLPFDFFSFQDTPGSRDITSWFEMEQPNDKLVRIEIESGSTILNNYNLYGMILVIILVNVM